MVIIVMMITVTVIVIMMIMSVVVIVFSLTLVAIVPLVPALVPVSIIWLASASIVLLLRFPWNLLSRSHSSLSQVKLCDALAFADFSTH